MFRNYVIAGLRAMVRDRFHAAVNIAGLALSLAAALLIALYVQQELAYEGFFTRPGQVHRVEVTYQNVGQPEIRLAQAAAPTTEALRAEFPQMLTATSIDTSPMVLTAGAQILRTPVTFTDQHLFDVLDFPVAAGDARAALAEPGNVILTQAMARRLYGAEEPVGRTLRIADTEFRVAAILRDLPSGTHFRELDVLVSRDSPVSPNARFATSWGIPTGYSFIRLHEDVRAEDVSSQLPGLVERRVPDNVKAIGAVTLSLRPLQDIHLTAGDGDTITDRNRTALYALVGTAVFLILIACFNYVNLATARSLLRMKEAGMRKILGGATRQLVVQFMGETAIVTITAFILALGLAVAALPVFANLVDRELSLWSAASPGYVGCMAALLICVSLAAGAYPALYLAAAKPTSLFRIHRASAGGRLLRPLMVGLQFSFAVSLIIAASVVYSQVSYLRNFDLGFDAEGLLIVENLPVRNDAGRAQAFLDALVQSPAIEGASSALAAPDPAYDGNMFFRRAGGDDNPLLALQDMQVGYGYFDLLGLAPIAGRVFSPEYNDVTDLYGPAPPAASSIVISESAVPYYGFGSPDLAVGQVLEGSWNGQQIDYTIIGVVPDIHLRLGQAEAKPADFMLVPDNLRVGLVRTALGDQDAALAHARDTWTQMFPEQPFAYRFLEDVIDEATADDRRQSQLFAVFTGMAILIACMGLFGLVSFVAARRTREVAIRKVLGASTARVTRLLLWGFTLPVLLANLAAWPIAWIAMRAWLDRFPYRIDLSPTFFMAASALALALALGAVFARTWRVGRVHPAAALKFE